MNSNIQGDLAATIFCLNNECIQIPIFENVKYTYKLVGTFFFFFYLLYN